VWLVVAVVGMTSTIICVVDGLVRVLNFKEQILILLRWCVTVAIRAVLGLHSGICLRDAPGCVKLYKLLVLLEVLIHAVSFMGIV
jgi:hypothetical protein